MYTQLPLFSTFYSEYPFYGYHYNLICLYYFQEWLAHSRRWIIFLSN